MNLGKRNRNSGHTYERKWAKIYRDLGYTYCKTSRQASRLLDNSKVDLSFIPFNHQCKKVKAKINYFELLKEIEAALKSNYPPEDLQLTYPIIISHYKDRNEEIVVMTAESYINIIKQINLKKKEEPLTDG